MYIILPLAWELNLRPISGFANFNINFICHQLKNTRGVFSITINKPVHFEYLVVLNVILMSSTTDEAMPY